ncbi:T9SS C-terminal target domain-containing protein [Rhodohalobacter sp. SW132]|uniref:T9SS type A sorting domain-containing protein n=1 Tax=Rhodohalobacter sp. SW132 TaxID=2293433 RepID=UPI000E27182B|nr:T9SS type A sorting domain-containing protein [Rhodohalobacter sp. SW132]REL24955.1 T9SS C-terminal target domain-containing protein [Rhodohalobacter sp. SW132]
MIHKYNILLLILGAILLLPLKTFAQEAYTECPTDEAECLVEWYEGDDFEPISNALRNTIANDTDRPDDRVYVLRSGGMYFVVDEILNEDFHLHIRGQREDEVDTYFGPAKIQLETDAEGNTAGRLFTTTGDVTFENLWITGQHDAGGTGNYLPIRITGNGSRVVVDNCVFERSDFSLFGFDSSDNKVYITNSLFRNHINRSQQWEGRGLRFENGADSLIVENNTFMNLGMTVLQSEAAPINYVSFVHNTVMNVGRMFNAGNFFIESYIANNLHINHYWHGEGDADGINNDPPTRDFPYTGYINVEPLGPGAGVTDAGRRIVYSHNAHWRDPQFADYYADTLRAQPLFNAETDSMFNTFEAIYRGDNWVGQDPNLYSYYNAPDLGSNYPDTEISLEELVPLQIANIRDLREVRQDPLTDWTWDPGRDPSPTTYSIQPIMWPIPGDFSYTNSEFLSAGTNGLPLGDLNWQDSSAKDNWLANRESYMADIEAKAGEEVNIDQLAYVEAEHGEVSNGAEAETYDGFVEFFMGGSGYVEWTFELDEPASIDELVIQIRSNDADRGANLIINPDTDDEFQLTTGDDGGILFTGLTNDYDDRPDGYVVNNLTQESIDALNLEAGEHTLRWTPGWGWYTFSGVEMMSGGSSVINLTGSDATSWAGVDPSAGDDAEGWVPSGLRSVALGTGGTINYTFETMDDDSPFPAGNYFVEVYYENSGSANFPEVVVNGEDVGTFGGFQSSPNSTTSLTTYHFQLDSAGEINFSITGDDARVDYFILYSQSGGTITDIEKNEIVEGYELQQNYPNPFNPTTQISFTLPQSGNVSLAVYNVIGQRVAVLANEVLQSGQHTYSFDASNLASGMYLYRLQTDNFSSVRKMMLIK